MLLKVILGSLSENLKKLWNIKLSKKFVDVKFYFSIKTIYILNSNCASLIKSGKLYLYIHIFHLKIGRISEILLTTSGYITKSRMSIGVGYLLWVLLGAKIDITF